ncbi:NUDIX domain-containing protein [Methylocapsa sp. S129]|uniref:NUDIX domain-containing protein n=1 Tax=Methylocapsa sp. S129 TaxID=1641869 RepID=UPI00131AFBE0|nr:NUDIX domain-containing protein [Methylocapsa sp. S129]
MADSPKTFRQRIVWRLFHLWFLVTRPMTLGVRAIVIDAEDRVLLVRHTYVPGWHFPGGGVERGETLQASLARELEEEGHIVMEEEPRLHGIFFNKAVSPRDHVAVYVLRRFRQTGPRLPDREIAEARFFPRDALPEGVSRATRTRLAEILDGAATAQIW